MNLWQLKIFKAIVEQKSFSKAGQIVHLSQPTVSSHLKELEEHFGCRLIDRMPRQATATRAGELLYTYAVRLLDLYEETETAIHQFHNRVRGRIRIGGSTIPGSYILPKRIGGFTRRHPRVFISLIIKDTQQILEDIRQQRVTLGVVGARSEDKNIIQTRIVDDDMQLILPPDHRPAQSRTPISQEELLSLPFIVRETGSGTLKSIADSLQSIGCSMEDLNIAAEMGSTQAVLEGIKNGAGVSILSTLAVADDLATGRLAGIKIEGVDLKRSFYLSRHRHKSLSPLGKALAGYIENPGE